MHYNRTSCWLTNICLLCLQLVFLDYNVAIFWSGTHEVTIYVTTFWKKQICGLCGNYDGVKENDLQSYGPYCPNGMNGQVKRQWTPDNY